MERDRKLEELINEHGTINAPDDFTDRVMGMIKEKPTIKPYHPIIGKWGKLTIIAILLVMVISAFLTADIESTQGIFNLPDLELSVPEIQWTIPAGVMAAMLAALVMVISEYRSLKKT